MRQPSPWPHQPPGTAERKTADLHIRKKIFTAMCFIPSAVSRLCLPQSFPELPYTRVVNHALGSPAVGFHCAPYLPNRQQPNGSGTGIHSDMQSSKPTLQCRHVHPYQLTQIA